MTYYREQIRHICRFLCWTFPLLLWDGIRLFGLVLCLAPGFVRFAWYYCVVSNRISIKFGNESCRQTLDVYQLLVVGNNNDENTNNNNNDNNNDNNNNHKAPVVIFYTGGAWLIGYKMWGTLLARALNPAGVVVVIPDMRNYPWGTVPSMVEDVDNSIQWTFDNIAQYGGDPTNIVVVGQSAGGNVACVTILQKAIKQLRLQQQKPVQDNKDFIDKDLLQSKSTNNSIKYNEESLDTPLLSSTAQQQQPPTLSSSSVSSSSSSSTSTSNSKWRPTDIKGFVSLSAPYCLEAMKTSLRRHGLDKHIVDDCIFDGQCSKYDPMKLIKKLQQQIQQLQQQQQDLSNNSSLLAPSSPTPTIQWLSILPKIKIYHGDKDKTVPCSGSTSFYQELCKVFTATTTSPTTTTSSSLSLSNDTQQHQQLLLVDCHIYENWTHTDPILEGPMDADHRFHRDLFYLIKDWTTNATTETKTTLATAKNSSSSSSTILLLKEWPENNPLNRDRLCPHFLVEGARFCNPF